MANKQVHKGALANYEKARIPRQKLRDYSLNPNHPSGGNKARVFERLLGFERQHWEQLAEIIRARLPEYPALKRGTTAYGSTWTVYIPVVGLNGNLAVVTTGWIFKSTEPDIPILTSCFIEPRKQKELKKRLGLD